MMLFPCEQENLADPLALARSFRNSTVKSFLLVRLDSLVLRSAARRLARAAGGELLDFENESELPPMVVQELRNLRRAAAMLGLTNEEALYFQPVLSDSLPLTRVSAITPSTVIRMFLSELPLRIETEVYRALAKEETNNEGDEQ